MAVPGRFAVSTTCSVTAGGSNEKKRVLCRRVTLFIDYHGATRLSALVETYCGNTRTTPASSAIFTTSRCALHGKRAFPVGSTNPMKRPPANKPKWTGVMAGPSVLLAR